jgi:hypothetical protein
VGGEVIANSEGGSVEPAHKGFDIRRRIVVRTGEEVDGILAGGVEVLIPEIGAKRPKPARELGVERSRAENGPVGLDMPYQHALVEDLIITVDEYHVHRSDGFANRRTWNRKVVMPQGETQLQAEDRLGADE